MISADEVLVNLKTVELPWVNNEAKISCIPAGVYSAIVGHRAPRFGWSIWLQRVPGRSEILIHAANFVHQLRGCIAPGLFHRDIDGDGIIDVSNSGDAMSILKIYLKGFEEIEIEIVDPVYENYVETHTDVPDWRDFVK